MVRGEEEPELTCDWTALLGGASWGLCRAALASSASERVRLLPSSDVGSRMLVAGALSQFKVARVSYERHGILNFASLLARVSETKRTEVAGKLHFQAEVTSVVQVVMKILR